MLSPPIIRVAQHLCRGNFRSTFLGTGGYEPVAETLFNRISVHGYFMEYDTERAGGFEPLRLVPKGRVVVLGLVTTKSGSLEAKDAIKRRIDEAAKFVDIGAAALGHDQLVVGKAKRIGPGSNQVDHIAGSIA